MPFVWIAAALLYLAACAGDTAPASGGFPVGDSRLTALIAGVDQTVYVHRSAGCQPRLLLMVFHGTERHAAVYRDDAEPLAGPVCGIVVAPEFDRQRFPRALYQYGGTAKEEPGERTIDLVPKLIAWARQVAGADLPVVLIGHSAGAQFLGRVAAFVPTGAAGIILANPSTWVLPSTTIAAPYGFADTEAATDEAVRTYLARPVTVLLGTADTGAKELAVSPGAMAQGANRHERGLNTFHMAQGVARAHGWALGWTLSEVAGVGHDARAMFGSAEALAAVRRAVP